jgi:hypothetical protein
MSHPETKDYTIKDLKFTFWHNILFFNYVKATIPLQALTGP